MSDILTYLETQLASFVEVPFNAVDSALLAQFCMARGEGVMPRLLRPREAGEEAAEIPHGRRGLRALVRDWRERRRDHRGPSVARWCGEGLQAVGEDVPRDGGRSASSRPNGVDAGAASLIASTAPALAAATAAERDKAEEARDAAAPTGPVRFADMLRAELFPAMFSGMHQAQMKQQLFLMAASPRFRDLLIYDHTAAFDEALDLQFAATTYVCPGCFAYVGFRGTDTTLTGWREDFNMAYLVPVAAQDLAARYLTAVAADPRLPEVLVVGGHSKGGNLAEYAALTAAPAVQRRIAHLYSHDGPGFMAGTFSAADYAPLAGRMTKQVPEDSMVGILMESEMPVEVVKATGRGFEQHSVFRWEVEGRAPSEGTADGSNGAGAGASGTQEPTRFVTVPELPDRTRRRALALRQWLATMDGAERERMVDALFDAVRAAGITDASQIFEGGREWAILRDGVMKAPMADRTTMLNALRGLTRAFSDATAELNSARRASKK